MASNLIEMFQNTVGDLLVSQSSALLGESAENTSSGVGAIVPTLLAAVVQKGSTDEGSAGLLKYVDENNIDGTLLSNVSGMLGGNIETEKLMYSGAVLLRFLLDDKLIQVADQISGAGGLKSSSSTSLLKLSAPLLMNIVGKQIHEKGLDAPGLKNLLQGQQEFIKPKLPAAMAAVLGLNSNLQPLSVKTGKSPGAPQDASGTSLFSRSLPWIVLMIAALGLFYFVQKGCSPAEVIETPQAPEIKDTTKAEPVQKENPVIIYTLPDGKAIHALPGSFAGKMATFLAGTETGEKCIPFDNVHFENGSFKIAAGSQVQLNHLATLMKAYPDLKIRIEAHTDEEGDGGKNKNLSKERAKVIKTWLTEHDIASGRIDTKGWGEEKPVASNKTKAGREKNRRIEVCLNKK